MGPRASFLCRHASRRVGFALSRHVQNRQKLRECDGFGTSQSCGSGKWNDKGRGAYGGAVFDKNGMRSEFRNDRCVNLAEPTFAALQAGESDASQSGGGYAALWAKSRASRSRPVFRTALAAIIREEKMLSRGCIENLAEHTFRSFSGRPGCCPTG
jgi:hypothetical protein